MSAQTFKPPRYLLSALSAGGILFGSAIAAGAISDTRQFAFSYLFAFLFFFSICAGALFWILVHHMAKAEWSTVVRRQLENVAALFLILSILVAPLIFVAPKLWSWMDVKSNAVSQPINVEQASRLLTLKAGSRDGCPTSLLKSKRPYLTPSFFWMRTGFYLLFFSATSIALRAFSIRQDQDGNSRWSAINRKLSLACIPVFAFAFTFASIDWLMGLVYRWFSTIWGVYLFAGSALSSLCVLVLIITAMRGAGYFQGIITLEHYHILGKLLLAFTMFWAYIAYSQYMLIWYSNIPEETVYFAIRNSGSWRFLNLALVAGHFLIPFLLLLSSAGKRRPAFLCGVAAWILAMHMLDIYVIVLPVLHQSGIRLSWLDLGCPAAIGCTLAAVFIKNLARAPLWPLRDPRLSESIQLEN